MLGLSNSLTSGGVLSGGFSTPADLTDIIHWWRSDAGVEESDESAPEDEEQITKWRDQVGTEHATASSNFPYWDATEEALVFNGGSKLLELPSGDVSLSGDFSIWVRLKFTAITNADKFIIDSSNSNMFWRITNSTTSRVKTQAGSSGNNDYTLSTLNTSTYYNIGIQRSGSNMRLYVGTSESSTGAITNETTLTFDQIKGSNDDYFKTLIVCTSALSTQEISDLNTWLDDNL